MMAQWLDLYGPVVADTAYVDNKLAARDVSLTLPAVTPQMAEHNAMGKLEVPIPALLEALEAQITKIGNDSGFANLCTMESKNYEFRWVQDMRKADGSSKNVGCKAFLRGCNKSGVPGISLEPGSNVEGEFTIAVSRYQLIVDGKEYVLVDKLNSILRINGKDYMTSISSML